MKPDVLIIHLGYFKEKVTDMFMQHFAEDEQSFEENLETIRRLSPKRTVFTHIEEAWGRSYDDYKKMESQLKDLNIHFAYDGMVIGI